MSSEWKTTKLSDLGTFDRGKSKHRPRDASHLYDGPYPFIQTGDVTASGGRITRFKQTYSEAGLAQSKLWPANTLCITIAANIAETGLLTFPACFPDSVVGFTADSQKADVRYIEYIFRAFRHEVKNRAYGSVQENINLEVLRNLAFPVPSLEKQQEIADFLSIFDDRIALLRETNATLEAIAQALFKSWFVDFDPVRAKQQGRPPESLDPATAALFPDDFEDTELGPVPKGWNVMSCQKVIEVRDGTHASPKPSKDGYPLVTSRHITSGEILLSDTYLISEAEYIDISKRSKVDYLDVLITMIGTVGIPAFVLSTSTDFAIKNIGLFKTSNKPELSCYIYLLLKSKEMQNHLEARLAGTTQKYISLKVLREIPIIFPPNAVMQSFAEVVLPIFLKIQQNSTHSQTLATLRDTLLPRLISGRLRLPEAEAQFAEATA